MIGGKYTTEEAIEALEQASQAISSRKQKKGEVLAYENLNGTKNFPKLCTKLLLEHPFIFDRVKQSQVGLEMENDSFTISNPQNIGVAALSSMCSKTISYCQSKLLKAN